MTDHTITAHFEVNTNDAAAKRAAAINERTAAIVGDAVASMLWLTGRERIEARVVARLVVACVAVLPIAIARAEREIKG